MLVFTGTYRTALPKFVGGPSRANAQTSPRRRHPADVTPQTSPRRRHPADVTAERQLHLPNDDNYIDSSARSVVALGLRWGHPGA